MKKETKCDVCNKMVPDDMVAVTQYGEHRCFPCNKATIFGKNRLFETSDKSAGLRV